MHDLAFNVEGLSRHSFLDHDVYIFRGYNGSYSQAQALAQMLQRHGKIVIDRRLADGFIPSKFHEALVYQDMKIPHIRTYSARSAKAWDALSPVVAYPVVIKDVDSQRGQGVRLGVDEASVRAEIEEHGKTIIIQKFIDIEFDIRVLCVGERVIGAIKRTAPGDDFRTNVSLGGEALAYSLDDSERDLALRAHRSMGYDISGVDMVYDTKDTLCVIETNITPEWQGFVSATGINVAEIIIQHAVARYQYES